MKVIVLGGSPSIGLALLALSACAERSIRIEPHGADGWLYESPEGVAPKLLDDPFSGGGRSKGEKKRAARQRRLMGGY